MTPHEQRQLLDLYAAQGTWCQEAEARDARGMDCTYCSPLAARWSLVGALWKVCGQERALVLCEELAAHIGHNRRSIPYWRQAYAIEHGQPQNGADAMTWRWNAYRELCDWEDRLPRGASKYRVVELIKRVKVE